VSDDPRIYTVDFVTERLTRGTPRWAVHHIDQDGNGGGVIFPKDTVEWRAAEYGLTDIDEILDVILHEPHLPDAPDRDDAALRAGYVTSTGPDAEPITLFNAVSTADAWAAHQVRIARAKETRSRVVPPAKGPNPLDVIRAQGLRPAGVRAKRELVDIHRWHALYGGLPVPMPSPLSLEVPRA
jgi:hypothetical protein